MSYAKATASLSSAILLASLDLQVNLVPLQNWLTSALFLHHVKSFPYDHIIMTVKINYLCLKCLRLEHFVKQCKSHHKCWECQKPHHSFLHMDSITSSTASPTPLNPLTPVFKHCYWCKVQHSFYDLPGHFSKQSLDNSTCHARLWLIHVISLWTSHKSYLPRSQQISRASGIAGLSHSSLSHAMTISTCPHWVAQASGFMFLALSFHVLPILSLLLLSLTTWIETRLIIIHDLRKVTPTMRSLACSLAWLLTACGACYIASFCSALAATLGKWLVFWRLKRVV